MEKTIHHCGDDALLLWYAADALEPDEAAAVAHHLERCERCQGVLEGTVGMADSLRSVPPHLTPERIVELAASARSILSPFEQEHVGACSECREVLAVVRRVEETIAVEQPEERSVARSADARGVSWWQVMQTWFRGPMLAYLLLLMLVYPAYRGVVELPRVEEQLETLQSPTLLSSPRPVPSEGERTATGEAPLVERTPTGTVLSFFVPVDEGNRYAIELRNERGETLFSDPDARSFDRLGTFVLMLPAGALSQGRYELRVEERDRDTGAVENTFAFPFTLTGSGADESQALPDR